MHPIDTSTKIMLSKAIAEHGLSRTAAAHGVHITALRRALDGGAVTQATAQKLAKAPKRLRTEGEFSAARATSVSPPRRAQHPYSWASLEEIRNARTAQLQGRFAIPVALAQSLRTNAALFVAYQNRVAPLTVLQTRLEAKGCVRGAAVAAKAQASVIAPRSVISGIHGTLVNHGVAIGYIEHSTTEEGTRTDMRLTEWPLEYVTYDSTREVLRTTTKEGGTVDILHGDGRWIVFRRFGREPWGQTACILPAALVWAANSGGWSDWAGSSQAHGNSKLAGCLPEGVPLQADESGTLTPEGAAFLRLLQDLASGDTAAGIKPFGAEIAYLSNGSTAWQVFKELVGDSDKAASRIYQGTDAALGSVGGAPGVDIAALFGVATTLIQSDATAIEQGLNTGLYEPWTAINEGDSRLAPSFRFLLPDPDEDAHSAETALRLDRLFAAIEKLKTTGFVVDQGVVDRLAKDLRIDNPPKLASQEQQAVPLTLAPTDLAIVVRGREARASQGLPPFGDERDDMTIAELKALAEAQKTAPAETPV